jgi:hypothetical protein
MAASRTILKVTGVAVAVAFLGVGCSTTGSRSVHTTSTVPAAACEDCVVKVVDQVPLPVNGDQAVMHQGHAWLIVEHSCTHCEQPATRFFAEADFKDPCLAGAAEGGCCVDSDGTSEREVAQVSR